VEPNFGAPAALLILCCERRLYPRFATVSNTLNMLLQVTMFVAVGMTFAIASRGIDLTVGSTMALVSIIVALLINQGWRSPSGCLERCPVDWPSQRLSSHV